MGCHRWTPKTVYGKWFNYVRYLEEMVQLWSIRRTFDDGGVETFESWRDNISCYDQVHNMNYIHAMPTAYDEIGDYARMWRAVIFNEEFQVFNEFALNPDL